MKTGKAAQEKALQDKEEKQQKVATKLMLAQEGGMKATAQAENIALEREAKKALAEAARQAENKKIAMQEANVKLANWDTQSRFCEANKFRRRRTCACDDTTPARPEGSCKDAVTAEELAALGETLVGSLKCDDYATKETCVQPCIWEETGTPNGRRLLDTAQLGWGKHRSERALPRAKNSMTWTQKQSYRNAVSAPRPASLIEVDESAPPPPPYSLEDNVRDEKKLNNWERRRYVRRRYVTPTAADRRRRFAFPAPPPKPKVPSAVCPCKTSGRL